MVTRRLTQVVVSSDDSKLPSREEHDDEEKEKQSSKEEEELLVENPKPIGEPVKVSKEGKQYFHSFEFGGKQFTIVYHLFPPFLFFILFLFFPFIFN